MSQTDIEKIKEWPKWKLYLAIKEFENVSMRFVLKERLSPGIVKDRVTGFEIRCYDSDKVEAFLNKLVNE